VTAIMPLEITTYLATTVPRFAEFCEDKVLKLSDIRNFEWHISGVAAALEILASRILATVPRKLDFPWETSS
jgi:hypothetical protein